MERGGREWWRSLGRLEKALGLMLLVYVILRVTGAAPDARWWLAVLSFLLGLVVAFRLARRGLRKAIWRLRNRLIAAYIFIAVVPIVLILLLVGALPTWGYSGNWGYGPSGMLGLVLVIILILVLLGHIPYGF